MPAEVSVYRIPGHTRSKLVTDAMMRGIDQAGDRPILRHASAFEPSTGIAVFYGLMGKLWTAIQAQREAGGTAVYIDLGYWGRREGGRWTGYHKVAVNARHPTEYFQKKQHDRSRFERFNIRPADWKDGKHILIAGMGDKGASAEGYQPGQWEREAVTALRGLTDRPIVYRPKPSWRTAKPIEGTSFSPHRQRIGDVLQNCYAVVTHHSNVAVDALLSGIPAFCWGGVATCMTLQDLGKIEDPLRPEGREQWAADIAWTQWSMREMAEGWAWRHLRDEGLVQ